MQNDKDDLARPRPTGVRQNEQVPRHAEGPSAATAPERATHTPGPWEWIDVQRRGAYLSGELRGMFGNAPATYPILNKNLSAIDGARVAVDEANAHLIAAAPELLEACRVAEEVLDGALSTPARMAALRALQDAIAKAEGR